MSEPTVDVNPSWEADGYQVQDRSGYTLDFVDGASPYYVVTRDEDGVGIGAYGSDKAVDEAIARDKEWLASRPQDEDPTQPRAAVGTTRVAESASKEAAAPRQALRLDR